MKTLRHVMVAGPVCVHRWQTVADVRRTMLVTDFSDLPIGDGVREEGWETLTAQNLAAYLATDRAARLGRTVDEATKESERPLKLRIAPTESVETPVGEVWNRCKPHLPLVVTRNCGGEPLMVGIVTSFDLL